MEIKECCARSITREMSVGGAWDGVLECNDPKCRVKIVLK